VVLYNVFIAAYVLVIRIASLWDKKAKNWIQGRRNIVEYLSKNLSSKDKIIWIHSSSAGEFEQGKPIIVQLKRLYPGHKILITFFSPSGYAVAKNFIHADFISYIPVD